MPPAPLDLAPDDFSALLARVGDEAAHHLRDLDSAPIRPSTTGAEIRWALGDFFASVINQNATAWRSGPATALRACITNHRTTDADVDAVVEEVLAAAPPP